MFATLWAKAAGFLALIGAILSGVIYEEAKARKAGEIAEREKAQAQVIKDTQVATKAQADVAAKSDAAVQSELATKWNRP